MSKQPNGYIPISDNTQLNLQSLTVKSAVHLSGSPGCRRLFTDQ